MRILIDECVDPRLKQLFTEHSAATVFERGWQSLDDGALLRAAQQEFDVLLTIDRNLEFQQNVAGFKIGVVVARVPKNQIGYYETMRQGILEAIGRAGPGQVLHVSARTA